MKWTGKFQGGDRFYAIVNKRVFVIYKDFFGLKTTMERILFVKGIMLAQRRFCLYGTLTSAVTTSYSRMRCV